MIAPFVKSGSGVPQATGPGLRNLLLFAFGFRVLPAEALDAARSVENLLLAGKERVASRADFDVDVAPVSRASQKGVAACAMHTRLVVIGVDSCFHDGSGTSVQNIDDIGACEDSQQRDPGSCCYLVTEGISLMFSARTQSPPSGNHLNQLLPVGLSTS